LALLIRLLGPNGEIGRGKLTSQSSLLMQEAKADLPAQQ